MNIPSRPQQRPRPKSFRHTVRGSIRNSLLLLLLLILCWVPNIEARVRTTPSAEWHAQNDERELTARRSQVLRKKKTSSDEDGIQEEIDFKDDSDRKAKKTKEPSSAPTLSPAPTASYVPSSLPSVRPSPFPSPAPSRGPTRQPSVVPTLLPSPAPSVGPTDSPTTEPSANPTMFPTSPLPSEFPSTSFPSEFPTTSVPSAFPTTSEPSAFPTTSEPSAFPTTTEPSVFPTTSGPSALPSTSGPSALPSTSGPSSEPTSSASPTVTKMEESEVTQDDGTVQYRSECMADLPDNASPLLDQIIEFQYKIFLRSGVNPQDALGYVENKLQINMTSHFLKCPYGKSADEFPFLVRSIRSTPLDELLDSCENTSGDANCFLIQAGFTANLFYRTRRLQQDQILDTRLVQAFGPFLRELLSSGWMSGPYSEIVSFEFLGFSNVDVGNPTLDGVPDDQGTDDTGAAGIAVGVPSDSPKTKIVMGAVVVTMAALVLAILIVVAIRQKTAKDGWNKRPHVSLAEHADFEDDESLVTEDVYTSSPEKSRPMGGSAMSSSSSSSASGDEMVFEQESYAASGSYLDQLVSSLEPTNVADENSTVAGVSVVRNLTSKYERQPDSGASSPMFLPANSKANSMEEIAANSRRAYNSHDTVYL